MPYNFHHLTLDLHLGADKQLLGGTAQYRVSPRLDLRDTLLLHAAHMDIKQVLWQSEEVEYILKSDSLLILPPAPIQREEQYNLEINFEKKAEFGVLQDYRGTMWSSLLPKTQRHWFPVFDHPRNSFTATISFSADGNEEQRSAVFSGTPDKQGRWQIEKPVPATTIGFAFGNFETSTTLAGNKSISLYSEQNLLDEQQKADVLNMAYSVLTETQKAIGIEYPFNSLDVIILEDHYWERKQYATGLGYVYTNAGNVENQIRQVILAQWMGIQQHEEQWIEAGAVRLLQAWLHAQIFDEEPPFSHSIPNSKTKDTPELSDFSLYSTFSNEKWNNWLYSYQLWEKDSSRIAQALNISAPAILEESRNLQTWTWHSLSEELYRDSGFLWKHIPLLHKPPEIDTIRYEAEYLYDDLMSDLKIVFRARDSVVTQLVTTDLTLEKRDEVEQKQIVFTGEIDTVDVSSEGSIRNARLMPVDTLSIQFEEHKPASFWLYQLRVSERVELKAEAADNLKNHTDNPDLQLAILDVLNRQLAPSVEAALLQTLAAFTDGAVGTEQQFLKALSSSDNNVALAALKALKNYPDNQQVKSRVKRVLQSSESTNMIQNALHVYAALTDNEQFAQQAEQLMASDTTGTYVPTITDIMTNRGDTSRAVALFQKYSHSSYSYSIRHKMIEGSMSYSDQVDDWEPFVKALWEDSDPRIRYMGVELASNTDEFGAGDGAGESLKAQLPEEYDARVYQRILHYIQANQESTVN